MSRKSKSALSESALIACAIKDNNCRSILDCKSSWLDLGKTGVLVKHIRGEGSERLRVLRDALAAHQHANRSGAIAMVGKLYMITHGDREPTRCPLALINEKVSNEEGITLDSIEQLAWTMPVMEGGLGADMIARALKKSSSQRALFIDQLFAAALEALSLLHNAGYMHGDASWMNVFFKKCPGGYQAKWIDFESSCLLDKQMPARSRTGSPESTWGPDRYYTKGKEVLLAAPKYDFLTLLLSLRKEMGAGYFQMPTYRQTRDFVNSAVKDKVTLGRELIKLAKSIVSCERAPIWGGCAVALPDATFLDVRHNEQSSFFKRPRASSSEALAAPSEQSSFFKRPRASSSEALAAPFKLSKENTPPRHIRTRASSLWDPLFDDDRGSGSEGEQLLIGSRRSLAYHDGAETPGMI